MTLTLRELYQSYHIESDQILAVVTLRDELLTINIADVVGAGGKSIRLFTEPVDHEVESFLDSVVERIRNIRGIRNDEEALKVLAELFHGYCLYWELKTQGSRADMWNYKGLKEFWDSEQDLISQIRKIDYESKPLRFVFDKPFSFKERETLLDKKEKEKTESQLKDLNSEMAARNTKIVQFKKQNRFKKYTIEKELLKSLIDNTRKKNGKHNFSKIAEEIGCHRDTVKRYIKHFVLENY